MSTKNEQCPTCGCYIITEEFFKEFRFAHQEPGQHGDPVGEPGENGIELAIRYAKREVIDDFVKLLLDAFPEGDRNNRCPAIYYDDYCEIVEECATRMKGGERDDDISREAGIRVPGGG